MATIAPVYPTLPPIVTAEAQAAYETAVIADRARADAEAAAAAAEAAAEAAVLAARSTSAPPMVKAGMSTTTMILIGVAAYFLLFRKA